MDRTFPGLIMHINAIVASIQPHVYLIFRWHDAFSLAGKLRLIALVVVCVSTAIRV